LGVSQLELTECRAGLAEDLNHVLPLLKAVVRSLSSPTLTEAAQTLAEIRRSSGR
jgi:hypothetical protein